MAAAGAALCASASAQQAGVIDWSALGIADEAGVPRTGLEVASGGTRALVNWRVDTNGGFATAPNLGQDHVSYEEDAQGGFTGFAQFSFDTALKEPADRVVFFVAFTEPVRDVAFTLTDIDQAGFDDAVGVYVNRGNGYENARGGAFPQPVRGSAVIDGTTAFGAGWQGNANVATTATDGNLAFDFGALEVQGIAIVYASGTGGTDVNPGNQQVGLSDIAFTGPPPPPGADLSLAQAISDEGPEAGDAITYTLTLTNDGPSPASVTVRDVLPTGVTYASDDGGGAYDPGTGLWQVPGPVPAGGTRTLTITATVRPNGQRTNLAEVWTSDEADADSTPGNADADPFEDDTASASFTLGGTAGTGGSAPPLSCTSPGVLDWDANPWPSGALSRSYTAGGTAFGFAIDPRGASFLTDAAGAASPVTNQDNTGGLATPEDGLYLIVDQGARSDAVLVTADVGVPGVGVSELQFTIFDVDYGGGQFEDRIAVAGRKGGSFVAPVLTPSSENRIEGGQALGSTAVGGTGAGGNVTVTFREPIDQLTITYGNGPRAPSAPGQQAITIHDLSFCTATGAQVTASKSVAVYDPAGEGLYMLPGNDAAYTISVANTGDGATDPDTLFLTDALPGDVTFWSGDVDGAGPQSGPVAFVDQGSGLAFAPSDVRFSSAAGAPASFAACTYAPTGGYDPNVRHVCLRPRGALQAGDPAPGFSVWFRARID